MLWGRSLTVAVLIATTHPLAGQDGVGPLADPPKADGTDHYVASSHDIDRWNASVSAQIAALLAVVVLIAALHALAVPNTSSLPLATCEAVTLSRRCGCRRPSVPRA